MPRFKVTAIVKDYWIAEIEAENEDEAEDIAKDICQAELPPVSEKEKLPTLQFQDTDWDFPYVDRMSDDEWC